MKFYFGLDLAYAYREPAPPASARRGSGSSRSCIRQVPADHDSSDVTARRILNWIYAWQGFGRRRARRPDAALAGASPRRPAHVRATLTPERNHRTLELYALLLAALAVPGLDETAPAGASRWTSSTATCARTSGPTASTAKPRPTTT